MIFYPLVFHPIFSSLSLIWGGKIGWLLMRCYFIDPFIIKEFKENVFFILTRWGHYYSDFLLV